MAKENKAQRVERIKKEKDGLDVLNDIYVYAVMGEAVDPEDIDRFKWYGLYTQNRNLQDEEDETLYFMLRVKVEQGELNLDQLTTIAQISKEFCRDTADITTRQDIQFHFVKVVDLPEIFRRLEKVGLSTQFAAGDVPRNVTTCAVSGIEHDEVCDVRPIVDKINNYLRGNKNLSNLPRKYKIGVSACHKHCLGHEIQDLSFQAVKDEKGKILFDVHVGGGLASNKRIASHLGFVTTSQILPVVKAISTIYRDFGFREKRTKARLGHLLDDWGIEKFLEEVQKKAKITFKNTTKQEFTPYAKREHFGVHESKEKNRSYIGCAVPSGYLGSDLIFSLVELMKEFDASKIRTTTTQNFIIADAVSKTTDEFSLKLKEVGIDATPSVFKARTLACTGLNFCKFAISETKDLAVEIIKDLEKRFPNFDEAVSLSLNGCPNACAHPYITNFALMGTKFKVDKKSISGYDLLLNGNLQGEESYFAQKVGVKFQAKEASTVIGNIIQAYLDDESSSITDFLKKNLENEQFISSLHS